MVKYMDKDKFRLEDSETFSLLTFLGEKKFNKCKRFW